MQKKLKKQNMPKAESLLLALLEKHMLLLAVLFMSLLALYLRKVAVWWNYADILGHFDHHKNHTETVFYYLLLKMAEYIPILPLHSFKWLGGLSDFALALLCAGIAGQKSRIKQSLLYLLCLFSPVVFLRGIIWAQPDSAALSLLLCAWILERRYQTSRKEWQYAAALLAAGVSIALTPCLLAVLGIYAAYRLCQTQRNAFFDRRLWCAAISVPAVSLLLLAFSALLLKTDWREGMSTLLRFGTYHPLTGALFETPGEWLAQMLILFGLPASVCSLLYAARKKSLSACITAVFTQFVVTLLYSSCLF